MPLASNFPLLALALIPLLAGCTVRMNTGHAAPFVPIAPSVAENKQTVRIVAAGDIACDPKSSYFSGGLGSEDRCHMKATADVVQALMPDAVLLLGDIQYESGSYENFMKSYDRSWGKFKAKTYPAIGNHEGESADAGAGYCKYFGPVANCNAEGTQGDAAYYSFDAGRWHLIALNSNCAAAGGCDSASRQYRWLRADLAAHRNRCTLAYWHHPRFSSGSHGNHTRMSDIFSALYRAGVEVVLSGHDHNYERFAPQTPEGVVNLGLGVRQFVVGTGGKNFYEVKDPRLNSEVTNHDTYGVLELTLSPKSYAWRFVHETGGTFRDKGKTMCH